MARHLTYTQRLLGDPVTPPAPASLKRDFEVPESEKVKHTWIMAGPGSGKTSLVYREIFANLEKPDPPGMVIIDPKGTMLDELSQHKAFEDNDRLVVIDPTDPDYTPALALFTPPPVKRFRMYSDKVRRGIQNQTVGLISYVLASKGQPFTGKQANCFTYLSRLMFMIDGATIGTLLDVLKKDTQKERWLPYISRMDENAQRWFKDQYFDGTSYGSTRTEIADRLYGITAMTRAFSTTHRKLDMFDALQKGKTVIVNIPLNLEAPTVELFGRYIIALTLAAVMERPGSGVPKERWKPAYLFMDEAPQFADDVKTAQILQLAREYKLGMYFIHQDMGPITEKLSSALGGVSIKYFGKIGANDAYAAATELRCSKEEVLAAESTADEARFLCYVSGYTKKPVLVSFPFAPIYQFPRMSPDKHAALLERCRAEMAIDAVAPSNSHRSDEIPDAWDTMGE